MRSRARDVNVLSNRITSGMTRTVKLKLWSHVNSQNFLKAQSEAAKDYLNLWGRRRKG